MATHDDTEKELRAAGRRQRYAGLGVGAGGVIAALGYRILHDRPLPVELFVLTIAVAAVLITMGLRERANRQPRAQVRHAMDNQRQIMERLVELSGIHAELKKLNDRLGAIEETIGNLPDYGAGVIDGIRMRQSVVSDHDG